MTYQQCDSAIGLYLGYCQILNLQLNTSNDYFSIKLLSFRIGSYYIKMSEPVTFCQRQFLFYLH